MISFKTAKITGVILISILTCIMLSCCDSYFYNNSNDNSNTTETSKQLSKTDFETNTTTNDEAHSNNTYYNYYLSGKSIPYQNAIRNNIVDLKYSDEASKCFTTQEQIELENKYMNIWKNELNHAISILTSKCNEQLKEEIMTAQAIWEESLLLQMDMEKKVLFKDIGSGSVVQLLSKYKDAYRYRTLEIKYLSYSIEFWENPLLENYSSLTFISNTEDGSLS